LLLENGAKIEAREEEYDGTALHLAAANGHEKVIEVLLEMGADIQATGGVYSNAVQAAIAKGHESAAQMLIERGADVNAQGAYFG
ncbi:ankyrin, partial [Cenococcum geophilum 1.58]|uniref:ankyrin n=1 Tax=Cenococcum geophilum 1.58 TaxID=794803 RepID=UPI00358E7C76